MYATSKIINNLIFTGKVLNLEATSVLNLEEKVYFCGLHIYKIL